MSALPLQLPMATPSEPPAPSYAVPGPDAIYRAILQQAEPRSGNRGWVLMVHTDHDAVTRARYGVLDSSTPRMWITKPGLRSPTLEARLKAVRGLGFTPIRDTEWTWREATALVSPRTVLLYAVISVWRIPTGGAA